MTTTVTKTSRKYYAGAYEKTVTVGGETVERTRIGDSVVHVRTTPAGLMPTPSSAFEYVHRDHLGSVEAVTDASGNEPGRARLRPVRGAARQPTGRRGSPRAEIETLLGAHGERVSRGFTKHEHLDRTGLIHMNGRVYDPRLGRFPSPDPDCRGSHFQPVVEPLQLRRQQPVELCRPNGAGSLGRVRVALPGRHRCMVGLVELSEQLVGPPPQRVGPLQRVGLRKPPLQSEKDAQGHGPVRRR